jgi:hypothetical protein
MKKINVCTLRFLHLLDLTKRKSDERVEVRKFSGKTQCNQTYTIRGRMKNRVAPDVPTRDTGETSQDHIPYKHLSALAHLPMTLARRAPLARRVRLCLGEPFSSSLDVNRIPPLIYETAEKYDTESKQADTARVRGRVGSKPAELTHGLTAKLDVWSSLGA